MLHLENLRDQLPPNAVHLSNVQIQDIRYVINANGKIEISMRISDPIYANFCSQNSKKPKTRVDIIDVTDVRPNDQFEIWSAEDNLYILTYWILINRVTPDHGISVVTEPTHCPVCQSRLLFEEDGYYCINSVCPAQLKLTIRKFLFFVSEGTFIYNDFKILDLMITQTIIRSPVDLFTITPQDLFSVGCRFDVAEEMVKLIHGLLGTVTISKYLKSLNLNISDFSIFNPLEPNQIVLNETLIDSSFHSMMEFLDWWKFIISTPGQSPEPYMNETTFIAINNYLNYPENLKIIYELDSFGLFKYL